ncbi:MAG: hypothetical protein WBA44_04670 [Mesorhizobium sp.]
MHLDQDILGLTEPRLVDTRTSGRSRHALHKAAAGLAELRRTGSRLKTRDLVGFMLSHGARSWRASLPEMDVRLRVSTPLGGTAIRLRLR